MYRRLRQHNGELSGGAKRTSSGRPWQVVALVTVGEKIPALKLEWQLEPQSSEEFLLCQLRQPSSRDATAHPFGVARTRRALLS